MLQSPLVSIVLPVYNGAARMDEAIESCLRQTYRTWEMIIVNDGSTDETQSRAEAWVGRDPRIHLVNHPTNKRLPAALNSGFAATRGELLTWTSDDNIYRSNALELMVGFLETNTHVDLVYCDFSIEDRRTGEIMNVVVKPANYLLFGNCVGACFMYRRTVFEGLGDYDDTLFLAEDADYWMRAFSRFQLQPLHENLYVFRIAQHSLTARRSDAITRQNRRKVLLKNLPTLNTVSQTEKAQVYLDLVNSAYLDRERTEMWRCFQEGFRRKPLLAIRCVGLMPWLAMLMGFRITGAVRKFLKAGNF